MPNWVRNVVKMQGIGSLPLYRTGAVDGGEDGPDCERLDFGKLIPVPKELGLPSGGPEDLAMEAALTRIAEEVDKAYLPSFHVAVGPSYLRQESLEKRVADARMTMREAEELGMKYLENIVRYGHSSWYGWCVEHWGTKWNAVGLDRIDEDMIAFDTAWSEPGPIITELSARWPDRMVEHWWADEDVGQNTGYRCIEGGEGQTVEPEDGSPEALENYVRCWGTEDGMARDRDGKLYIVPEEEGA